MQIKQTKSGIIIICKKMNKCQHNMSIDQFCISQHCQWKQPGGCQQCIKKYHTHYRQQKLISEHQLTQYMKIFSSIENSHKPNCRSIQQGFYTYFNQLKNQLTQVIDLLCKTVINFIGTPYLMQNKLFNCFKRIKNKQYRRLNQKDINKFCQVAKSTSTNSIIKQQGKLYKQQLKKFNKLVQNLQSLTLSYEELLSQASLTYKHDKSQFDNLSSLIKQTLQITDPKISISQFHEKSLEKNKIDKSQKTEKSQHSAGLRLFNSQQYEKSKSKHNEINIPSFYSGILPNREKQQKIIRTQNQLIGSQTKRQSSVSKDLSLHKLGVRDFSELQKKQNNKQTINTINIKRPSSLQKNLPSNNNNRNMLPQMLIGKNNKGKNDFRFDEFDEFIYPQQVQKQKIHLLDNYSRKKSQGIGEIFGTENTSTFFTSQESKRTDSFLQSRQKRQLSQKQADINYKKQKLIQMMKTYQFSKKSSQPIQIENNLSSISTKNYSKDTMTKQKMKKENKQMKNNSVVVNPMSNSSQMYSKQTKIKHNLSLVVEEKGIKSKLNMQRKFSFNDNPNAYFNNIQIEQINPINECISQTLSVGSLEAIKQLLPENNMNGGLSKLPMQEEQQKPKVMACSRLIIVPTSSKFPNDHASDSPLIKKRKVTFKETPQQKTQNLRTASNSPSKVQKKQSIQSSTSLQKQDMTELQQKSLSLLIKSISQKPQQAILTLQSALKQSPNNLSAAEYLSFLYLQCQKPRQALIVCNKILEKFQIKSKENEELLINLQINKSAALNMLGRYSQAIVLLLRCMKIKQTDCLFKNLADAYYFSSDYDKAISYYEKTVRLSPNHDEAYHNMAVCFYLQQNYQRAKHALQRAIELSPKNVEYLEFRKHVQERLVQKIR